MKPRGRPKTVPDPETDLDENGLYSRQWKRIQKEAKSRNLSGAQYLRYIVDTYFAQQDSAKLNSSTTLSGTTNSNQE